MELGVVAILDVIFTFKGVDFYRCCPCQHYLTHSLIATKFSNNILKINEVFK